MMWFLFSMFIFAFIFCIGVFSEFIWLTRVELAEQLDDGKGLAQTVADIKDANQRGALHFAAREGQTEMCKFLIEECNIDVNVKDEDGNSYFQMLLSSFSSI